MEGLPRVDGWCAAKVVLKGVVGMSAGAAIGLAVSLFSTYVGSG